MQAKQQIKTVFTTLLIITSTIICYWALNTVSSWNPLKSTDWNDIVNIVNSHETKINSLSNNWWLDTLVVTWSLITCLDSAWTNADVTCPAWYTLLSWGCYWNCVWIAHPNWYPFSTSKYRCARRATWVQSWRTLYASAMCGKIKQ